MKMDKKELAIAYHDKKFNCCQAVACAFAGEVGVSEEVLFKAGEGFGLGMGGMEGTCGALSGAIMLAGMKNSDGNIEIPATKASTYQLSKELLNQFREKTGSTVCKELKGVETGCPLRSCDGCIEDAAAIAEQVVFAEE